MKLQAAYSLLIIMVVCMFHQATSFTSMFSRLGTSSSYGSSASTRTCNRPPLRMSTRPDLRNVAIIAHVDHGIYLFMLEISPSYSFSHSSIQPIYLNSNTKYSLHFTSLLFFSSLFFPFLFFSSLLFSFLFFSFLFFSFLLHLFNLRSKKFKY